MGWSFILIFRFRIKSFIFFVYFRSIFSIMLMYRQTVGSFTIGDVSVLDGTSVVSQIRTQKAALESQKRDSYSNIEMDKKEGVI